MAVNEWIELYGYTLHITEVVPCMDAWDTDTICLKCTVVVAEKTYNVSTHMRLGYLPSQERKVLFSYHCDIIYLG